MGKPGLAWGLLDHPAGQGHGVLRPLDTQVPLGIVEEKRMELGDLWAGSSFGQGVGGRGALAHPSGRVLGLMMAVLAAVVAGNAKRPSTRD